MGEWGRSRGHGGGAVQGQSRAPLTGARERKNTVGPHRYSFPFRFSYKRQEKMDLAEPPILLLKICLI